MPKTIKEVYQDYAGYTNIEYSDTSTRRYSVDDVATVVNDSNGKVAGIATSDGATWCLVWKGTQAEYDAIPVKSATVLYVIV